MNILNIRHCPIFPNSMKVPLGHRFVSLLFTDGYQVPIFIPAR